MQPAVELLSWTARDVDGQGRSQAWCAASVAPHALYHRADRLRDRGTAPHGPHSLPRSDTPARALVRCRSLYMPRLGPAPPGGKLNGTAADWSQDLPHSTVDDGLVYDRAGHGWTIHCRPTDGANEIAEGTRTLLDRRCVAVSPRWPLPRGPVACSDATPTRWLPDEHPKFHGRAFTAPPAASTEPGTAAITTLGPSAPRRLSSAARRRPTSPVPDRHEMAEASAGRPRAGRGAKQAWCSGALRRQRGSLAAGSPRRPFRRTWSTGS